MDPTTTVWIDSPLGTLRLDLRDDGTLTGLHFHDDPPSLPPGPEDLPNGRARDTAIAAREQLQAYFRGERAGFDLPVDPAEGSEFQRAVWDQLRLIPYGETWTYGRIAERIGRAGGSQAVGLACGANPVSIVIPCHRVIGRDGSLTGFGGGLPRKRFLLDLENPQQGLELE